ncbi:cation:proton antiporter [Daejeonella lutea]|uniref:NhaP-type Na+/H+ or K+/H+ antiporter n=1 Tax=Daejeonella lutea TaxID=572036 RepID=A0A1T5AY20_9SPHI|nr:cation:proton antiporter [Daejeonella lutea]SKB39677.1 NhaP-type Na+/H+ or K+/H+ antiporter [Daejeonella lutea]
MNEYFLLLSLVGLAAFGMAWMPAISRITGISYSIIYLAAGVIIYLLFPNLLPKPDVMTNGQLTIRLTELVVIVALMGTGIKIDRSFSLKNWSSPLRLIFVAMIICIAFAALLGYTLLSLNIGSALLLGAALAPTDPVLASDVQVGPPNERIKSETRFSLTAEAGLNDGMAFPFTWLAILFAVSRLGDIEQGNLLSWFGYHLIYKIIAAIAVGYIFGRVVGYLVFKVSAKFPALKTRDGFLAISLTLMVYGVSELLHVYGFVAVFISSITLRHFDKKHDYHDELHSFADQTERLLVAMLLILFGGALVGGILAPLTWQMCLFTFIFLFLIRPGAALLSLAGSDVHVKEKLAISFFGIRGMGSVFYLAFAFQEAFFGNEEELWAIVAFTILISVLIHGMTATPVMNYLKREIPKEKEPD